MPKQRPVTLNYDMLASTEMTSLPTDAPVKELKFTLEGTCAVMYGHWIIKQL